METASPDLIPTEIVCSVCIANYNGRGIIDDCIGSVLAQHCSFEYEIIVHDDASPDNSADDIASRYPQVKLLRSDKNVGFCASNNRMATQARGQFLLLLNNDATLEPDALQALHDAAAARSEPAIITLPQINALNGEIVDRGLRADPFLNPVPNLDPARTDVATVHGACLWVPRSWWNEVGGFPDWFDSLAEDLYLCCLTRLWGGSVRVAINSRYHHRIGHSLGGGKVQDERLVTTVRRRQLSERNKTFVMYIFYPWFLLWIALPLHLFLLVVEGTVVALVRKKLRLLTAIYLGSIAALWSYRRQLYRARRRVQLRRTVSWKTFFSTFAALPQKLRLLQKYGMPGFRD